MLYEYEICKHPINPFFNLFITDIYRRNIHYHSDYELLLKLDDAPVDYYIKGDIAPFRKNTIFLMNPLDIHGILCKSEPSKFLCLHLKSDFIDILTPDKDFLRFDAFCFDNYPKKDIQEIIYSFQTFAKDYFLRQQNSDTFRYMSSLYTLIETLLKKAPYVFVSNDDTKNKERLLTNRLDRISRYIDENYLYRITLTELAEHENLSISYLSHFFQKHYKSSFQDYITFKRLENAKSLLRQGMSPSDASFESGFSDPRYLRKAFQKYEACTPIEYQASWSKVHPLMSVGINNLTNEETHLTEAAAGALIQQLYTAAYSS